MSRAEAFAPSAQTAFLNLRAETEPSPTALAWLSSHLPPASTASPLLPPTTTPSPPPDNSFVAKRRMAEQELAEGAKRLRPTQKTHGGWGPFDGDGFRFS